MFRKGSIILIAVSLLAATAITSVAQSGRGRQLRIQEMQRGELPSQSPALVEGVAGDQQIAPGTSDRSSVKIRKSPLIYNDAPSKDDGEYHMTKGDKRAGWILLGLLVIGAIVMVDQP
jgi:hypothetical protein